MSTSILIPVLCLDENAQIIYEKQTENELFLSSRLIQLQLNAPRSTRSHSRYCRNVDDLPISGHHVHFQILTHKWFCDVSDCPKSIFTERLSWFQPYKQTDWKR